MIQLPKPKRIQLGNWEADVLTKDQLQYAATDAFVSRYLYEVVSALNSFQWCEGCYSYYYQWCCFGVKQVLRSLPDVEKVATNKASEEVKDASPSGQSEQALDARTRDQAVKWYQIYGKHTLSLAGWGANWSNLDRDRDFAGKQSHLRQSR